MVHSHNEKTEQSLIDSLHVNHKDNFFYFYYYCGFLEIDSNGNLVGRTITGKPFFLEHMMKSMNPAKENIYKALFLDCVIQGNYSNCRPRQTFLLPTSESYNKVQIFYANENHSVANSGSTTPSHATSEFSNAILTSPVCFPGSLTISTRKKVLGELLHMDIPVKFKENEIPVKFNFGLRK